MARAPGVTCWLPLPWGTFGEFLRDHPADSWSARMPTMEGAAAQQVGASGLAGVDGLHVQGVSHDVVAHSIQMSPGIANWNKHHRA
jgi:hypothetical protein